MIRESKQVRNGWQTQFEDLGFSYHSIDGLYWDERYAYRFNSAQIDTLEQATIELHQMCLEAVDHIIRNGQIEHFSIPRAFWSEVEDSWKEREFSLYGRFDLSWNGSGHPKMLEYNADTPTGLVESSVAQWYWLQDVHPDADQFNSLHEKLIEQWKKLNTKGVLHFVCADSEEDIGNLSYLRDTAIQAGFATKQCLISSLGWDEANAELVDDQDVKIDNLFKLYPWEWLCREQFSEHLLSRATRIIEPAWKMLLSNKAILPILWERFPNHPNLLPAFRESWRISGNFVKKPLLSREGENISIYADGNVLHTPGEYGEEGFIYQAYAPQPKFDDGITPAYTSIGSWVVGDEAAGIGIREDETLITKNTSRFIPHYFVD
ncbi:glutathionylspermidine synthase family protein [Undibacterium cyanobacteriorum]|uniref:Glutathionylspermidine synthase family protein n=1 Tax=Undibacterium cyanobacteriorum TaxID=3073561 RepID=A0ABY9RLI2_9BURK|nr:glutathionylspermidine synthase family protein [Undibacterium sp. 20NA77.5]WMW82071.1 glutathionylspermidine synthase family protein [Undibacterium sp. 20NA77.5]